MRLWVARPDEYETVERLMREYVSWLPFDVSEFQDFDREMAEIQSEYGPPSGLAMLASLDERLAGVAGVRRVGPATAELKRMWVRPEARGHGLGQQMARRAIAEARGLGYRSVRLDTVTDVMTEANHLYDKLGFVEIEPYRDNPLPGARFMELDLDE